MIIHLEPRTKIAICIMSAKTALMVARSCKEATLRNELRHAASKNIDAAMNIWRKENA